MPLGHCPCIPGFWRIFKPFHPLLVPLHPLLMGNRVRFNPLCSIHLHLVEQEPPRVSAANWISGWGVGESRELGINSCWSTTLGWTIHSKCSTSFLWIMFYLHSSGTLDPIKSNPYFFAFFLRLSSWLSLHLFRIVVASISGSLLHLILNVAGNNLLHL